MAGINGAEALILMVIILIVVGPDRLPHYAAQLGKLIRKVRSLLSDAQGRVRDELGAEGEEIPWESLDPRQYDPRKIVRDAMRESNPSKPVGADRTSAAASTGVLGGAAAIKAVERDPDSPPPFDSEAT